MIVMVAGESVLHYLMDTKGASSQLQFSVGLYRQGLMSLTVALGK